MPSVLSLGSQKQAIARFLLQNKLSRSAMTFYQRWGIILLELTFGHILAMTAIVGPPTYPAPMQQILSSYSSLILILIVDWLDA
jgi:hypothetical protein